MLRWGSGSVEQTWRGASGAPITPSKSLRSDLLYETEGVRDSWSFIQFPIPDPTLFESPFSESGPSINGVRVSPSGLKLPDLATEASELRCEWFWCFFLLRRPEMGEPVLAGLVEREREREREGERPLTTSSFKAEKKPCFFSIWRRESRNQKRGKSSTVRNSSMRRMLRSYCAGGRRGSDWWNERKESKFIDA